MSNKGQGKGWRTPSHSKHISYVFLCILECMFDTKSADLNGLKEFALVFRVLEVFKVGAHLTLVS